MVTSNKHLADNVKRLLKNRESAYNAIQKGDDASLSKEWYSVNIKVDKATRVLHELAVAFANLEMRAK